MNTEAGYATRLESAPSVEALVTVVSEADKTLEDLKRISRSHYVLFTPHVGNKWREDLYLLKYGIPTANFERNASALDDLDFPEKLRVGGAVYDLAEDGQLKSPTVTPYLRFRDEIAEPAGRFVRTLDTRKPGQLHHKSTLAAIENGSLMTSAEALFLGPENRLLRDLFQALHLLSIQESMNEKLRVFTRYIDGQGRLLHNGKLAPANNFVGTYHYGESVPDRNFHESSTVRNFSRQFLDFAEKLSDSIHTGDPVEGEEGPVPRNEMMVLLLGLKPLLSEVQDGGGQLDLDDKGRYHAYAVSGPSMIKYAGAKDFRSIMSTQYAAIRQLAQQQFGYNLPAELVLHMIPGGSLSYLPVQGETQAIDAINKFCETEAGYRSHQAGIGAAKRPPTREEKSTLAVLNSQLKNAVMGVVEASVHSPHISQYDLLSGHRLLPESDLEALEKIPFKQHIIIANLLDDTRKKLLSTNLPNAS